MAAADLAAFLEAVDSPPAEDALVQDAQRWFIAQQCADVLVLEGLTMADIDAKLPENLGLRSFIRRAVCAAGAVAEVKRRKIGVVTTQVSSQSSGSGGVSSVVGSPTPSALALLAAAGADAGSQCDITKMLRDAHFGDVPSHVLAEVGLWNVLDAAAKKALKERPPKIPFSYVDLTGHETLPVWIPQATLNSARGHQFDLTGTETSPEQVQQLMSALKAATSSPRALQSIAQWHAAWRRYEVVAVATGHMTRISCLNHLDVIDRTYEEERLAGKNPLLAIVYDEQARREWARRAERRDPAFKIEEVTLKRDDMIMEAARMRLNQGEVKTSGQSLRSSSADAAEDAMVKQEAAAAALARRASEATKQLAKQQEQLARQQASGNAVPPEKAAPSAARQWWGDRRGSGQGSPKGSKSKNAKGIKGGGKGGKDGRREY